MKTFRIRRVQTVKVPLQKERILLALNTILEKEVENAGSCVCPCIVGQTEERRDHREPNSIIEGLREERGMATAP